MAQIIVKKEKVSFYPYDANVRFEFTYKGRKGICWYQVYDTDDVSSDSGILTLEYDEEDGEDINYLIHKWVDENIEYIPIIKWKEKITKN